MAWLLEQAIQGKPGQNFWWVAPIFAQAKIPCRRIKRGLPRELYTANETELTLTLANETVLWFKGADHPDSLYGEDVYAAVIDEASRCFVAGTPVDTPLGARPIQDIRPGDAVWNATGQSRVRRVIRKRATAVVAVTVQGYTLVSSVDHRYLTRRGWVEAQHLESTDHLVTQSAAMRLLRRDVFAKAREAESAVLFPALFVRGEESANRATGLRYLRHIVHGVHREAAEETFLRSVLLSEVENDAAKRSSQSAWARSTSQECRSATTLVGARYARDSSSAQVCCCAQCDAHSRGSRKGRCVIAQDRSPTALAGWQGAWPNTFPTNALDGIRIGLGLRTSSASEAATVRFTDLSVSGSRLTVSPDLRRGGWQFTPPSEDAGCGSTQGSVLTDARVEGVEVLQSGDPRFAAYSGGADTVELFDLVVEDHPSFSVHGFLVHNCKEDAWHAVRSTLTATRGPIRLIGNVKGRKNWAYQLARKAEAGEPDWHYAKITAHDAVKAGILAGSEVADAERVLPEHVFRELYLAEPSDDGGNPFGLSAIQACIAPLSSADPQAWGVDLAKSVDWTVATGLDADRCVSRFQRFQKPWQETINVLGSLIGRANALVDSTGVGDPVTEALQRVCPSIEGYRFTSTSKQQLMEGLSVAIGRREVHFPDGPIRAELEQFEYEYTRTGVRYSAPTGSHDDCVCSLALAVQACQSGRTRFF